MSSRKSLLYSNALTGLAGSTGQVLRDLVYAKYGKTYDLSIVRRQIAGVTIVALNIMWTHLDQRSFPMSEAQFMEKLDAIAEYLRQDDTPLEAFQSIRALCRTLLLVSRHIVNA